MRIVVRLALVAVLAVLARHVMQRQALLRAVGGELDAQHATLADDEAQLDSIDRQIDDSDGRIADLARDIAALEAGHPDGIPASLRREHARLVTAHNEAVAEHNALVARHNALRAGYAARVERHNAEVADANEAVAASGPCALLPDWLAERLCR
jgi:hypothetical protein